MHLVLRDQARGELLRDRRIALVVGEDQLELGAAEIRQAGVLGERQIAQLGMRVVDDLGGDLGRRLRGLPGGAGIAGQRPHDANLDASAALRGRRLESNAAAAMAAADRNSYCVSRIPPDGFLFGWAGLDLLQRRILSGIVWSSSVSTNVVSGLTTLGSLVGPVNCATIAAGIRGANVPNLYDVTTITVRPNTQPKALAVAEGAASEIARGLVACWYH